MVRLCEELTRWTLDHVLVTLQQNEAAVPSRAGSKLAWARNRPEPPNVFYDMSELGHPPRFLGQCRKQGATPIHNSE